MATLTVQQSSRAGVAPVKNAVSASDDFVNDGRAAILVENGSGGSLDVTIVTSAVVDGLAVADRVVTIPDGEAKMIGPFSTGTYGTSTTLEFSSTTTVTCQLWRIL